MFDNIRMPPYCIEPQRLTARIAASFAEAGCGCAAMSKLQFLPLLQLPLRWLPRFAGIRKAPNQPLKAESGYISSVRDMSQYDVLRSYLRASFTRSLGTICSWKV